MCVRHVCSVRVRVQCARTHACLCALACAVCATVCATVRAAVCASGVFGLQRTPCATRTRGYSLVPCKYPWVLTSTLQVPVGTLAAYALCDTYPRVLFVPSDVSDDSMFGAAKFRSKGRVPVLTYPFSATHARERTHASTRTRAYARERTHASTRTRAHAKTQCVRASIPACAHAWVTHACAQPIDHMHIRMLRRSDLMQL